MQAEVNDAMTEPNEAEREKARALAEPFLTNEQAKRRAESIAQALAEARVGGHAAGFAEAKTAAARFVDNHEPSPAVTFCDCHNVDESAMCAELV